MTMTPQQKRQAERAMHASGKFSRAQTVIAVAIVNQVLKAEQKSQQGQDHGEVAVQHA